MEKKPRAGRFSMKRIPLIALVVLFIFSARHAAAQDSPQTFNLKQGFNFVAFTMAPAFSPAQMRSQFASIEDIYSYNAAAGSFLSVSEGTLSSITAGKGYIIKAKENSTITMGGSAALPPGNITLKEGFNLVGISRAVEPLSFSALMAAGNFIRGVYKYNPAAGAFIQVVRNASGAVETPDGIDPVFTAGQSYFIEVKGETRINYDSGRITVPAASIPLSSISLSVSSGVVRSTDEFDLSGVIATAAYGGSETKTVTPVWTVKSGGGVIGQMKYKPTGAQGTVVLTAAYTEGGFTATADLTLTVNSNPGLTGWWRFEEGSGTLINDSSGNNNFGFFSGGAAFVDGIAGRAIKLDGSASVQIQPKPSIDMVNDMSISVWAKIDPATGPMSTIISKGHTGAGGNHGWAFRVYSDTMKGEAEFFAGIDGKWQTVTFAGMNPPDNSWHLFTGVKSRSGMFAYVDGALRGSNTTATNDFAGTSDIFLTIGGDSINGRFIKGVIDEVRIYNYAMSAAEILNYYNATRSAGAAAPFRPALD